MAFDLAAFRLHFPEFSNVVSYPDAQVNFWAALAELEISTCRFGDARPYAVELLTAHYLASAKLNTIGSNPGTGGGAVTSKKVGDVSVSYDTKFLDSVTSTAYSGTRYGVMLSAMMRRYGAGAVQL